MIYHRGDVVTSDHERYGDKHLPHEVGGDGQCTIHPNGDFSAIYGLFQRFAEFRLDESLL